MKSFSPEQATVKTDEYMNSLIVQLVQTDYIDGLMDVYALTISLVEAHPEQVNNEIRNALTHLGRAANFKSDAQSFDEELKKAKGHFERAKKDCLKLCIAELHDTIQEQISLIEFTEGVLNSKYKKRLVSLESQRQKALEKETRNDLDCAVELLEKIANDLLDLRDQLNRNYDSPNTNTAKFRRLIVFIATGNRAIITVCSATGFGLLGIYKLLEIVASL